MIRYAIVGAGGVVLGTGYAANVVDALASGAGLGSVVLIGDDDQADGCWWDGEALRPLPPRPGPWAVWTGAEWADPRTAADHDAAHEAMMQALRAERDRRLTACDWTQMPDAPLTDGQRAAWRDYRTALRDLPTATIDPTAPAWPDPPI